MTSQERAQVRHDAALIEEKLYKLRLALEGNHDGAAGEYADQIREVAARIVAVAGNATAREEAARAA